MVEATTTIHHEAGLHARPLAIFAKLAKSFKADIQVENLTNGKGPASGKSPINLLVLTAKQGHEIRLRVHGDDEEAALQALLDLVANDFVLQP